MLKRRKRQDIDIPERDIDIPKQDIDIPEQDINIPEQDIDIPEQDINIPEQDIDIPEQDHFTKAMSKERESWDINIPEQDLLKTYYVPAKAVERVMEIVNNKNKKFKPQRCGPSLLELQSRNSHWSTANRVDHVITRLDYCYKRLVAGAVYAQNWDKLAYLLQKMPVWEHSYTSAGIEYYLKTVLLLLMHHPTAQAQGLLNEYMHMVLSCRTIESKKAVLKVLLTLTDNLYVEHDVIPICLFKG